MQSCFLPGKQEASAVVEADSFYIRIENAIEHSLLTLADGHWNEELIDKIIDLLLDNLVE